MRKIILSAAVILLVLSSTPSGAEVAFRGLGGRAGATISPDQVHIGIHADLGTIVERVRLQPNVEIGFGDNVTTIAINPEAFYEFPVEGNWKPYAGGGLGITIYNFDVPENPLYNIDDSQTEIGLNLLGGVQTKISDRTGLFFEAKVGVGDIPDFKATAGFTVWFQ